MTSLENMVLKSCLISSTMGILSFISVFSVTLVLIVYPHELCCD